MEAAQKRLRWALKSESRERIAAMLALAKSELAVTPDMFNRDPMLLNCPNGTLDLRTGTLREHRREDYITKLCPTTFDPAATCPQWEKFLATILSPAVADYMRRSIGYCLTGDVREQILTFWWGAGSNGKSVLKEVILHILGADYAGPAPDGLLITRRGEQHPTEMAKLFGQRFVIAAETQEGSRLDEAKVKRLTGGDKITGRRMREDFWDFDPTHKLVILSNHKPRIVGTDEGIWRRVLLIPFPSKFWDPDKPAQPGEDRDPRFRADKQLLAKLKTEAPGILAGAVRGCLEWQREGLQPPAEVIAATEQYRAEQDLVAEFLGERCTLTGNKYDRIRSGELFATFQKWADAAGERTVPNRNSFFPRVRQLTGFDIVRNNGSWFCGVTYKHTNDFGFQEEDCQR